MRWLTVVLAGSVVLLPPLEPSSAAPRRPEVLSIDGTRGTWTVAPDRTTTRVTHEANGSSWSTTVARRWVLPDVTIRHRKGGASADGTALALVQEPVNATESRFAVVTRTTTNVVALRGRWSFDALAVDGRTLYLTESVGRDQYWVRSVDVVTGRVGEPLVTKSISPTGVGFDEGPMAGLPMDRVITRDGTTVFTLYDGPSHPFVHALDVAHGGALCYELIGIRDVPVARLRLQLGTTEGSVDVRDGTSISARTVAQIFTPSSSSGPSVRIEGTSNATR